jgi:excisionase family DNA binding protein
MAIGSSFGVDYAMKAPQQPDRTGPRTSATETADPGTVVRYVTIQELAAITTLSVSTLRRLLKKGKLVGHQPGGPRTRIVFRADALELAAKAMQEGTADEQLRPEPTSTPTRGPRPRWQQVK